MGTLATILFVLLWLGGMVGTFVPIVPATALIWGAALLHAVLTGFSLLGWPDLALLGALGLLAAVVDNLAAAWGARRYGGSRAAGWGALVGGVLGLFSPLGPLGFVIGPILGAVGAELLVMRRPPVEALRSGFGTLLGLLGGIGAKLVIHGAMGLYVLFRIL